MLHARVFKSKCLRKIYMKKILNENKMQILTQVSKKPLIFFTISEFFYNNVMKFQENSSLALQQSIN